MFTDKFSVCNNTVVSNGKIKHFGNFGIEVIDEIHEWKN